MREQLAGGNKGKEERSIRFTGSRARGRAMFFLYSGIRGDGEGR